MERSVRSPVDILYSGRMTLLSMWYVKTGFNVLSCCDSGSGDSLCDIPG